MTAPAASRPAARRRRQTNDRRSPGSIAVLVIASLLVFAPFLWMISLAFTPEAEAFGSTSLIPSDPTLENFGAALDGGIARAFVNSLIVTVVAVATNCVLAVAAGYGFAMLPFRGSTALFFTLIATVAVPVSATLVPLFLMAKGFPLVGGNDLLGRGGTGLLDTLGGVVLPHVVMPLNIFLARQFFLSSDVELAEAARIDGANELRVFWQIYRPLARPIIAVIAIFSFTGVWDDFLWPLVVSTSEASRTVQLALTMFVGEGNVRYAALMAATLLISLPVVAVFIFNQRSFISGLTDGSVKG